MTHARKSDVTAIYAALHLLCVYETQQSAFLTNSHCVHLHMQQNTVITVLSTFDPLMILRLFPVWFPVDD